jgi:RNA polymerase sigma factor (sigma-70 family)
MTYPWQDAPARTATTVPNGTPILPSHADPDAPATERDLVGTYLSEISRTPLLTAAQEVELAQRIEAGLYAERLLSEERIPPGVGPGELERLAADGQAAKQTFVMANLRLVVALARRHRPHGLSLLDLIQEGNLGLLHAVEKFDYAKGYKFSTYATWWIRQAIGRALADQSRTIRLPIGVVEQVNRVRRMRQELLAESGHDPSVEEMAALLDLPVERVLALTRWDRDPVSLETPLGEDDQTQIGDLLIDVDEDTPEESALANVSRELLHELIDRLEPRQADILRARFGLYDGRPQSFHEIGLRHGLSGGRIRQIEAEARVRLRELVTQEGIEAA